MRDTQEGNQDKSKRYNALNHILSGLIFAAPLIASAIGGKAASEQDQDSANQEIARWTRVVGIWTRVLAAIGVLTAGVLAAQCVILINQQRALAALERPYLVVEIRDSPENLPTEKIDVILTNYGRALAIVGLPQGDFLARKELPPQFTPDLSKMAAEMFVPTGAHNARINWPFKIPAADVEAARRGEQNIYFLGVFPYRDGGGNWYVSAAAYVYNFASKSFTHTGDAEHNYMR